MPSAAARGLSIASVLLTVGLVLAQEQPAAFLLHARRVLSVRDGHYLQDAGAFVRNGSIIEVGTFTAVTLC